MVNQTKSDQGNCFKGFRFLPFPARRGSRSALYPAPQLLENVSLFPLETDTQEIVVADI